MKIVHKYGGSSLADGEGLRRVVRRVSEDAQKGNLIVVVSARGKETDGLTEEYKAISCDFPSRESDALLAVGEMRSAAILSAALNREGIPAVSLNGAQVPITVEGGCGNAEIRSVRTERIFREWENGRIPVITGFQGVDPLGDLYTLGRGGSDTTAVAVAAAIGADACRIFTDVDGVYTADPHTVPQAVKTEKLSYSDMLFFASHGAKVLHRRAALLAAEKKVPMEILSSFSQTPGTLICTDAPARGGIAWEDATVTVRFARKPTAAERAAFLCVLTDAQNVRSEPLWISADLPTDLPETVREMHRLLIGYGLN